jgi:hypothetical protein
MTTPFWMQRVRAARITYTAIVMPRFKPDFWALQRGIMNKMFKFLPVRLVH